VVNLVEEQYPYGRARSTSARLLNLCFIMGAVATFVGMDAVFWHISWLAGVAFPGILLVMALVCGWYVSDLDHEPDDPDETQH